MKRGLARTHDLGRGLLSRPDEYVRMIRILPGLWIVQDTGKPADPVREEHPHTTFQPFGDNIYRVNGMHRSAVTNRYVPGEDS